jgi:glycerophosphoryl diester phosphodiesterase
LDEERVHEIRGAGLRLATWTANEPARVADLLRWGVDTVITDAVDSIAPRQGGTVT